jgi:diketogulonate reductase-like aldo/keto reductase
MDVPHYNFGEKGKIPVIGFGTYNLLGQQAVEATKFAISVGYRLIDTASYYENEKEIGIGIKSVEIDRSKLFLTTKIWPSDFSKPENAIETSLKNLDEDYVDLFLIHWPGQHFDLRLKAYKALEKYNQTGQIKYLGVSNFNRQQILEFIDLVDVLPVVNQVHCSPFSYPKELIEFCLANNMLIEGYTPIEKGRRSHAILTKLAQKYNKSEVQIMLRWAIEVGVIPLPKSSNPLRIESNIDIFDFKLTTDEITKISMI